MSPLPLNIPVMRQRPIVPVLLTLLLGGIVAAPAHDVVYHQRMTVDSGPGTIGHAYLWVPPSATTIRGVIIGGNVLCEGRILAHPAVRAACTRESLATLYFSRHPFSTFSEPAANGAWLQDVLDGFTSASGHPELAQAPWMPIGHSVGTVFAAKLLAWKPERTWPLVAANLFSTILLQAMPTLALCVEPGGTLLLSGILAEQADEVLAKASLCGYSIEQKLRKGKWVSARASKIG